MIELSNKPVYFIDSIESYDAIIYALVIVLSGKLWAE